MEIGGLVQFFGQKRSLLRMCYHLECYYGAFPVVFACFDIVQGTMKGFIGRIYHVQKLLIRKNPQKNALEHLGKHLAIS